MKDVKVQDGESCADESQHVCCRSVLVRLTSSPLIVYDAASKYYNLCLLGQGGLARKAGWSEWRKKIETGGVLGESKGQEPLTA